MKSLRLMLVFLAATAIAVAQRSPSPSPAPSSPAPSSPSTSSAASSSSMSQSHPSPGSLGGSMQSHSTPSSAGGGAGAARSSGGNAGGGRPEMGGSRGNSGAGMHGNANSANRSDNNFHGARSNAPSNIRHGQPNSDSSKPEAFQGRDGNVSRSVKQPTVSNITPDVQRDHRNDFTRAGKPVDRNSATRETQTTPKRFHWFWQKRKDDGTKELAKAGRPELKKPTPCKGINCKPACPAGQTAGEAGRCVPVTPIHPTCNGTVDSHGNCILNESSADPCTSNGVYNPNCQQYQNRLTRRPDCSSEASRAASLRNDIEMLQQRVQLVCAQDPTGPICRDAQQELRRAQEQLMEVERQYQYCQSTRTQYP